LGIEKPSKNNKITKMIRQFPPPGHFFVYFRTKFGQFQTILGVFQAISDENGRKPGNFGRFWIILGKIG